VACTTHGIRFLSYAKAADHLVEYHRSSQQHTDHLHEGPTKPTPARGPRQERHIRRHPIVSCSRVSRPPTSPPHSPAPNRPPATPKSLSKNIAYQIGQSLSLPYSRPRPIPLKHPQQHNYVQLTFDLLPPEAWSSFLFLHGS
jgi:hypothetical protein